VRSSTAHREAKRVSTTQHSIARASNQHSRAGCQNSEKLHSRATSYPGGRAESCTAERKAARQSGKQRGRAKNSKTSVRQIKGKERRTCDRTQGRSNCTREQSSETDNGREDLPRPANISQAVSTAARRPRCRRPETGGRERSERQAGARGRRPTGGRERSERQLA
jgi:hypothetical protein